MPVNIKVRTFVGPAIKTYLPSIARLRVEVFRDFPYLYESDLQTETQYLRKYVNCKDAIAIIVFDGSEVVGASLGMPLEQETDETKKPFKEKKIDTAPYFYFGESMLLAAYRGRGIGHHFFDLREAHAQKLKKYKHISFSCIARPENDPRKPDDYIPLDDFWKKRGYVKHPDLICHSAWRDIGQAQDTEKPLRFWIKQLHKK